jgi:DNA-binding NarL/FixJ family response regulator
VHRGGALLAPSVAPHVLDRAVADRGGDPALDSLTAREREVLALLADGLSNRDIATALYVSEKTVKTHVSSILSKLHVTDRTQAALYAVRHDLGTSSGGSGGR